MGAAASNIKGHPLVPIHDSEGNAFPSGACFYLQNQSSDFKQTLKFDKKIPGAVTCATQDIEECKWLVEYSGSDRTKIAFKNPATGLYLAASNNADGASFKLDGVQVVWYVYQGAGPDSYWLSTAQYPDTFLFSQDTSRAKGSAVKVFAGTNKKYDGKPWYESSTPVPGLSWRLEPAPEYWKWKAQQRGDPSQNEQALSKRVEELEAALAKAKADAADAEQNQQAAKKNQQDEADLKARLAKVEQREREVFAIEEATAKTAAEMKRREERQKKAEQRIKRSSNPTRAEHLSTQEERDKATEEKQQLDDESKRLRADLEAAKKEAADLHRQLEQAKRSSGSGDGSDALGARRHRNSGFQWSIAPPNNVRPSQTRPPSVNPKDSGNLPPLRNVRPAQSISKGFNSDMMKRFEAGRKAMQAEK